MSLTADKDSNSICVKCRCTSWPSLEIVRTGFEAPNQNNSDPKSNVSIPTNAANVLAYTMTKIIASVRNISEIKPLNCRIVIPYQAGIDVIIFRSNSAVFLLL